MKRKAAPPHPPAADLRRLAEHRLNQRPSAAPHPDHDSHDALRLLHELEVHQLELEMQNSELKQTRDALEATLAKYTELYDFAPVGYFTLDPRGAILRVNLAGAAKHGIPRPRLVGKPFASLIATPDHAEFSTFLKAVFVSEDRQEIELTLTAADQPPIHAKICAQRLPDGSACTAVVFDITQRRLAEEQLRISEIRYRRLFETAHDGVLLVDPATRKITDANPFMSKLLSLRHEELVGRELYEIGLHADAAASRDMFRKLKKQQHVRYEDLPLVSKTGRLREVEVVANLYQENGHPVIQCNIRDITRRKQAEHAQRCNEALFAALVEQAPVGVLVMDDKFTLLQVNPVANLTFLTVAPVIGCAFFDIVRTFWSRRVADRIIERFRRTMLTGEAVEVLDFTERRRDLRVMESYDWQTQRVTLPSGSHGLVCFFTDITQRRKSEEAERHLEIATATNHRLELENDRRRTIEKSLKDSRRDQDRLLVQSRDQQKTLRSLSHQILTVQENERRRISRELHDVIAQTLVGINVHVAALGHESHARPADFQQKIARTQTLVEQAVSIVHEFARELRPTVLDDLGLIPALESTLKTFMEETGVRASLQVFSGVETCQESLRTVLYRVAQEALTNVGRHAHASLVEVSIRKLPGSVCMEIRDNGIGFDTETGPKKFRRLGLLGMKERVEMVGGSLQLNSVPGESTTVRAEFPLPPPKRKTRLSPDIPPPILS